MIVTIEQPINACIEGIPFVNKENQSYDVPDFKWSKVKRNLDESGVKYSTSGVFNYIEPKPSPQGIIINVKPTIKKEQLDTMINDLVEKVQTQKEQVAKVEEKKHEKLYEKKKKKKVLDG